MLGSNVLSVRLGGIYALQRLAKEHPKEYHVQIMRLFSAFARHPTEDRDYANELSVGTKFLKTREDVEEIVDVIGKRTECDIVLEHKEKYGVNLWGMELPYASLMGLNLTGASFIKANLSHGIVGYSNLLNALLYDANLSGTGLFQIENLTQEQLDQALADPNDPPKLHGTRDAQTGQPLVWTGGRGKPLKDD